MGLRTQPAAAAGCGTSYFPAVAEAVLNSLGNPWALPPWVTVTHEFDGTMRVVVRSGNYAAWQTYSWPTFIPEHRFTELVLQDIRRMKQKCDAAEKTEGRPPKGPAQSKHPHAARLSSDYCSILSTYT